MTRTGPKDRGDYRPVVASIPAPYERLIMPFYFERKTNRLPPSTSRRGNRSAMRFRHRKVAGTWQLEPGCEHDLSREPDESADARTPEDIADHQRQRRARMKSEQRRRQAQRQGVSVSELREQQRDRQRPRTPTTPARATVMETARFTGGTVADLVKG